MPVMKNSGRKQTMTARVARMIGGRTSLTAVRTAASGSSRPMPQVAGDVLDVDDRVVDHQAQREDQREERHAVDRVAGE